MLPRSLLVTLLLVLDAVAATPQEWIPLRWDGGPLEVARRLGSENPIESDEHRRVIEGWYAPDTLDLLEGVPYNCLVLTWSLGRAMDADARQRKLIGDYVALVRERGFAALGSVEFGPEWKEAVEAGATLFDGMILEGEFPAPAATEALALLRAVNPDAVVIPMSDWRNVPSR